MKTILKGFGFGMVLQIAVGPLCIYIIKTALDSGFITAFTGVLAVTLADAFFVTLALVGVGKFLSAPHAKKMMKTIGGVIIIVFGFYLFLSGCDVHISFVTSQKGSSASVFITALLLTLSSPLTIVFWAGVFGSRLTDENNSFNGSILFGAGAVLSTLVFLTLVSAIAGVFFHIITTRAIQLINWIAGLFLIALGVQSIFHKQKKKIDNYI